GDDRLERTRSGHPAAVVVEQLLPRHAERRLVDAGALHVPRDAVELGTGVLLAADRREPRRPALDDVGDVREGLDVVDRRRAAEDAVGGGERWLEARIAALPLDRLHQRGLFAADVGSRADMKRELAVPSLAEDVPARVALLVGLGDCALEIARRLHVLAADVDEAAPRPHRVAGDEAAFQHHVRIALHEEAVLVGPRLGLVGVADEVLRLGRLPGHEGPLPAGREPRAAAPAQARLLDLLEDLVGGHRGERLAQRAVSAALLVDADRLRARLRDVAQQDRLAAHTAPAVMRAPPRLAAPITSVSAFMPFI